jgi:transcriptional regulator with XRE-family HTH domain
MTTVIAPTFIDSRLQALNQLRERIHSTDINDDKQFQAVLIDAQTLLEMTDRDIATALSVSRPTVSRWMRGTNLLHPMGRQPVLDWLMAQARGRIRILEARRRNA